MGSRGGVVGNMPSRQGKKPVAAPKGQWRGGVGQGGASWQQRAGLASLQAHILLRSRPEKQ